MMTTTTTATPSETPMLNNWLKAVSTHLAVRRIETKSAPRPKRNRERERARREARQLFVQYDQERAIEMAS